MPGGIKNNYQLYALKIKNARKWARFYLSGINR